MKIRTILPIVTCLSAFAVPVLAQDAPAAEKKPEQAAEPAKPPADAPAPESAPTTEAAPKAEASTTATVNMGGTTPEPKKNSTVSASSVTSKGGAESDAAAKEWKTDFHGYIRVPFRVGMGVRPSPKVNITESSEGDFTTLAPGQSKTTFHAPIIPDGQYLSWQSTSHNRSDWAEMFFGVGNSWAKATMGLQGYNFTDSSYNDPTNQYGIGQAFVTLTPDLGYENMRMSLKVGAYQDKYGAAGKYDAGEYDTYLFGRTHVIGETLRAEYDLSPSWLLWLEEGVGGKRPDPKSFNNSRFTMLAHGHAGLKSGRDMEFTAHMLYSWAQEEDRPYNTSKENTLYADSIVNAPDGNMWSTGVDARIDFGPWGYFYGGYSHVGAKNALVVGRALEVIHASGGGEYQLGIVGNYFGPACRAAITPSMPRSGALAGPGDVPFPQGCSAGTGSVDTLLGQYEFSLTNFLQMSKEGGQRFWGDGPDLKVVLYGMLNKVKSDYQPTDKSIWGPTDGNLKLKYGTDIQWHAMPALTAAVRFDRLQPNSEIPEQSFMILSPRLTFTSTWLTREQLTFQYSRYIYNHRECDSGPNVSSPADVARFRSAGSALCVQPPAAAVPPDGFGINPENQDVNLRSAPTLRPDVNVFKVEATFWW